MNQLQVAGIKDHFVVCGYGQVGRTVLDQFVKARIPFVLVERDEGLCNELLKEGIPVVRGDAKRRDTLAQAGIERARGICALIDNDADNLYITITARSLNPRAKIIMRAGQRRYAEAMKHAGADEVIIPEYEGGLMVARLAEQHAGRVPKLE
jgi:voltage-gated potassium channel